MSVLVLDASVIVKAFVEDEAKSDEALSLATGGDTLAAPDLLRVEFAAVLWKRVSRGLLDRLEATQLLTDFQTIPIQYEPTANIIDSALEVAIATARTVYDSLYLATAIHHSCELVTADKKFVNAIKATAFAGYIRAL
jgi:predicted nucleic acid-binding protein